MFTVEQLRVNKPVAIRELGPFKTLHEAQIAARKLVDTPGTLIVGMDTLSCLEDGKEVERHKAGDII